MTKTRSVAIVAGFVLLCGAAAAEQIPLTASSCITPGQNVRVAAQLPAGVSSARVYFHADGTTGDYYVDMKPANGAESSAVLPKTATETTSIVVQVRATEASGRSITSAEKRISVRSSCAEATRTAEDATAASKLVVGQTMDSQAVVPAGFVDDGIVGVISSDGVLRTKEGALRAAGTNAATSRMSPTLANSPNRQQPKPVSQSRP
jgi:hypothetical protein